VKFGTLTQAENYEKDTIPLSPNPDTTSIKFVTCSGVFGTIGYNLEELGKVKQSKVNIMFS
jgi:hypothetical protein